MSDKGGTQRSEDVKPNEQGLSDRRGKAQLVVGEAPKRPTAGGKGLDSNAVYERDAGGYSWVPG